MSGWMTECMVCGACFESRPGESFDEFSDRLYDTHTRHHVAMGQMPDDFLATLQHNAKFCAEMVADIDVGCEPDPDDARDVFAMLALVFAHLVARVRAQGV